MAHKLPRLSKSLLEKPQLITLEKFQEISEVMDNRSYLKDNANLLFDVEDSEDMDESLIEDKPYGMLKVEGPTTYKPTGWEALCGGCSYTNLISQMEYLVEQGKKDVVMWINSPGGQAYRMMFTAKKLRKLADDNGVRLIGYVDGMACSAGMGLASACHELIANPESEVGSIGVVISLMNNSKKLEKEGLERKFITAGESKVPLEDDGSFKEGFIADLQESVNTLYEDFVNHVASMRDMDSQIVRDTEARVFKANKGLELGLIDSIMEEDEFFEYLDNTYSNPLTTEVSNSEEASININPTKKGEQMSDLSVSELAAKLAEFEKLASAQAAQLEVFKEKEQLAEKANVEKQLSEFSFAQEHLKELTEFMCSSETSGDHKSLMNSVLKSANLSITEITEKASTDIAKAISDKEEAQAEVIKVKEDFGKKQSFTGEVDKKELTHNAESGPDRTAQLHAKVQAKLKNKH